MDSVSNPWAPPPDYPPQQPYPPYPYQGYPQQGYLYGYGPPPPKRNRTQAFLVGGGIAVSVLAMLAFLWFFLAGGMVVNRRVDESSLEAGGGGTFTSGASDDGPRFTVELPPGYRPLPTMPRAHSRAVFTSSNGGIITIHSEVAAADDLDALMEEALREHNVFTFDSDKSVPRTRAVGGSPALMLKVHREGTPLDKWIAVFASHGARWQVTYDGRHEETLDEPYDLSVVLGGWRW